MVKDKKIPHIMIAGTNSGSGKTTITMGIISALQERELNISSYKCGPDYIDSMFHRRATGLTCTNLDAYLCDYDLLNEFLSEADDLAIIEGVMGYYDGIGTSGKSSSYDIAINTNTPVILVLNAKGMYTSAGAILEGFKNFHTPSNIVGVIFNNVKAAQYQGLAEIAKAAGVEPLGYFEQNEKFQIQSRHLGLFSPDEMKDLPEKIASLGVQAEKTINIDRLIEIANNYDVLPTFKPRINCEYLRNSGEFNKSLNSNNNKLSADNNISVDERPRIAIAMDTAFSFLYEVNLKMLEALGAELIYFSPLYDDFLPEGIAGLYLPGGYPELFKEKLSHNANMRKCIYDAIKSGLPTIAECGGFLYLHKELDGLPMVGVIEATSVKSDKLQRFGYAEICSQNDNLLAKTGDTMKIHEFHYYKSSDPGNDFISRKASNGNEFKCIHANASMYAGFPHLYFPGNPDFAINFMRKVFSYAKEVK